MQLFGFKIGHFCLKTPVGQGLVAKFATDQDKNTISATNDQVLTKPKEPLQKLQIGTTLMQNSIINGLFVIVAWHYEKINDMKQKTTHYEILLFTGTGLTSKQLADNEENRQAKNFSAIEELEKACWNGIIYEMFPEILGNLYPKCESFLWHVLPGKNFLFINIGPDPVIAEHDTSIDPYFFMMNVCEN